MAQKAHPATLRPTHSFYKGCTNWDEPRFYYMLSTINKLIEACCLGTTHYIDNIQINRHLGSIVIEVNFIHLHVKSKLLVKSRRHKENRYSKNKQSWTILSCRLHNSIKLIQIFTGIKKITLKVKRLKTYTRSIPKTARKQIAYYVKNFHSLKYDYARSGMQLISLLIKNRVNVTCLSRFIEQNVCSRQKRKRHYEFLGYLKQSLQALERYKKIKGLKIQLKGRFTHKAKGRSRIWKYQVGQMPLNQLSMPLQVKYKQTQTGYGGVGLKIWICN